jgi:hypothetical protein
MQIGERRADELNRCRSTMLRAAYFLLRWDRMIFCEDENQVLYR